ncbi:MAG: T9SS type A sorting domain-containing protein [Bacteroidota bacterium]
MKISFISLAILFLYINSHAQNRDCDPVVVNGVAVPCLLGLMPRDLVGFKYEANTGWVQIPIQVDERLLADVSRPYSGSGPSGCEGGPKEDEPWDIFYYADTTSHVGADPDPSFDIDDELVFMAKDVGSPVGNIANPAGTGIRCELQIYDPVEGTSLGYVYIFEQDGSLDASAGEDYIQYDFTFFPMGDSIAGNSVKEDYIMCYENEVRNTEASSVITEDYESRFSDRWTEDYLKIKTGNVLDTSLLDIHQITLDIDKCLRYTGSFATNTGVIISTIDGPVRAIRAIMGANSGRYNQLSIFFTKCQVYYRSDFRVHDAITQDVSQAYDMFDWTDAMNGAKYSNNYNPTPVVIDGNQDNLNKDELPVWSLYEGAQGSIVVNASIVKNSDHYTFGESLQDVMARTNNAGTAWDAYYDDAGVEATYQCTGDEEAYGTAGWVVYTNQCYDYRFMTDKCDSLTTPNEVVFNRTNYYLPPGVDNAGAARYADYARQPLQILDLDGIVLAAELTRFQANTKAEGVLLDWETATENDNAYFELQRSADGKSFEALVRLKGQGTSLEAKQYDFLDVLPYSGTNYYRLKQMDFDGDFEYSKIISVQWKATNESNLKIFPNPSTNRLYYLLKDRASIQAVRIYDAFGRLLSVVATIDGAIELGGLATGIYILEVQSNSGSFRKRFFKQ